MNRAEPLKSPLLLFHYFDFGPPKQIFQGLGARWFSVQSNLGVLGLQLVFGQTWGLLNAYCPLSSLTGSLSRGCLGFSLSLEVRGGFFVWGLHPVELSVLMALASWWYSGSLRGARGLHRPCLLCLLCSTQSSCHWQAGSLLPTHANAIPLLSRPLGQDARPGIVAPSKAG